MKIIDKTKCSNYSIDSCAIQKGECSTHCCCECKHGQEMTCTFVCPTAAEIMNQAEEELLING